MITVCLFAGKLTSYGRNDYRPTNATIKHSTILIMVKLCNKRCWRHFTFMRIDVAMVFVSFALGIMAGADAVNGFVDADRFVFCIALDDVNVRTVDNLRTCHTGREMRQVMKSNDMR